MKQGSWPQEAEAVLLVFSAHLKWWALTAGVVGVGLCFWTTGNMGRQSLTPD